MGLGELLARAAILVVFGLLYSYGGREGTSRAWRWLLGGLVISLGTLAITHYFQDRLHWLMWGAVVAYPTALSMGYGKGSLEGKEGFRKGFRRRTIFGLTVGACSLFFAIPLGIWHAGLFQMVISLAFSLYYGLLNPVDAKREEFVIGAASVFTVPFLA